MMNKREIFNRVAGIISELNEQFDYLSKNPDKLNDLELELFAANADFLSDHISILLKLNAESVEAPVSPIVEPEVEQKTIVHELNLEPEPEKSTSVEELKVEPQPEAPSWRFEIKDEEVESFDYEDKSAEDLFDRPLTEEELRVIDEKTKLKTIPEEEFDAEDIPEPETSPLFEEEIQENVIEVPKNEPVISVINEKEEEAPKTLNEILSAQAAQNTVSTQFSQKPVKDLKGLISLNDKLLFVRDLFNGYSLAYSEAIELINRFDSFDAADNFLKQNYAIKNNWAEKQDVADKFYEILNRRFSN